MEIKQWSYEEFPEFSEDVEGATHIKTSGDEIGVKYEANIEYAAIDNIHLTLQILRPFTRNNPNQIYPCIVFVQGSAWMKQDVYAQIPLFCNLAKKGYVIAIVQYRDSSQAIFPAQALDAKNAVRFIRKNAEKYFVNPDQILLGGDSSGGHTALFAAIIKDNSTDNLYKDIPDDVIGIIDFYGSVSVMRWDGNPTTENHKLPDSPEGMVMGKVNLRENKELCEKLSVECNISEDTNLPPTLILHGTKDRVVNTYNSVDLYRKMKECKKDVTLYLIDGGDHGGAEYWEPQIMDIVDRFIKRCILREE